jgi:hypothetical protein
VQVKVRALVFLSVALMLAYLVPNHYVPWLAFHQELLAAVAFTPLIIWGLITVKKVPLIVIGALLLSTIPLIQLLAGQIYFAGDGWVSWLYIFGFALTVLAGSALGSSCSGKFELERAFLPIFLGILFAALISVGIAIHQWLDLQILNLMVVDLRPGARPYANLAQANQLSTLLLLGSVSLVFLYESDRIGGLTASAASCLLIFGLAMTQSRTVLLSTVVIWAALATMKHKLRLKTSWLFLAVATGLFTVCSVLWPQLNETLLLTTSSSLEGRFGQDLRLTLWISMFDALGRSLWFGYGWNQVSVAQQAIALDHPATYWYFNSSHNIFLDLAIWAGLPLSLMVFGGLTWWFVQRVRYCETPFAWCLLLAISFVFCHAMVEFPLSYAYFLLPVGLMMGALEHVMPDVKKAENSFTAWFPFRVLGAAAGAMALTFVVIDYFPIEQQWRDIRFSQVGIEAAPVKRSERTYLLTQLSEDVRFATIPAGRAMPPDQLEWMGKVSERFAWAASSFKYAQALALNGKPDVAATVLSKLCKIQPPSSCQAAIKEWERLAAEEYPELRSVAMPGVPSL